MTSLEATYQPLPAPSGATKGFMQLFSHMQKYSPTLVNTLSPLTPRANVALSSLHKAKTCWLRVACVPRNSFLFFFFFYCSINQNPPKRLRICYVGQKLMSYLALALSSLPLSITRWSDGPVSVQKVQDHILLLLSKLMVQTFSLDPDCTPLFHVTRAIGVK